jgi:hypothetical protein
LFSHFRSRDGIMFSLLAFDRDFHFTFNDELDAVQWT